MFAYRRLTSEFARNTNGGVAILFGVSCIVLFGVIGLALDTSRYYNYTSRMQQALDAAALAGARLLPDDQVNDSDIKALITAHFEEVMSKSGVQAQIMAAPQIKIDRSKNEVEVTGTATLPAMLSTVLLPGNSVSVDRTSKVVFDMRKVEMSMVLDITGSMNSNNKLGDLKTAAKDVIEELFDGSLSEDGVRIAVAPYSASVNAGGLADSVTNIPATTTCTRSWYGGSRCTTDTGTDADSCVIERQGANAATDAAPIGVDKLPNVTTTPYGNYVCPNATVVPLQGKSTKDMLKSTIDGYTASGATAGHIGAAWGWYLLSPEWSAVLDSNAGKSYTDNDVDKSMIIMTDGEFNTSYLTGGSTPWSTQADESYAQFDALCTGAKAQGIKIFTVGFDLTSPRALTELQKCATGPEDFFDARTGAQLKKAFKDIAKKLNKLRVES